MDISTQSTLLAAIVGLALGLSMLLRGGRARVLTLYSFFALNVGGYYFAQFFLSLFSPATRFPWLLRIAVGATVILGALVPSTALAFFLEFLGVRPKSYRYARPVALLSAFLGLVVGGGVRLGLWRAFRVGVLAVVPNSPKRFANRTRSADLSGRRGRRLHPLQRSGFSSA